jgi:hypothetical protein
MPQLLFFISLFIVLEEINNVDHKNRLRKGSKFKICYNLFESNTVEQFALHTSKVCSSSPQRNVLTLI